MLKSALYHLFVPMGRTSRRTFWITLVAFAVLVTVFKWGLFQHDTTGAFYFWGFLIWMTMLFCGVFAIYGKRLKDFGRSVLPIITLFAVIFGILLVFGLLNGGGEYISDYSQFQRKEEIDAAVREEFDRKYQENASTSVLRLMNLTIWGVLIAFTAWVGLRRGDAGENRYGPPPTL